MKASLLGLSIFLLCFLSAGTTTALDDWTQRYPASSPAGRNYIDMAYIGGNQVLLFGGWDGSYDDETWIYDLNANTWTQKSPPVSPAGRYRHSMAYLGGDQVLLFSGETAPKANEDATWVYDLGDNIWTSKSPASKPASRFYHAMAYIGGDQALLFAGNDTSGYDDETWVYDLSDNTWTQKSPATKPAARRAHAMAYIGEDQVLLFGGSVSGVSDDETWIYDLSDNTWTEKSPATKPTARYVHAMAYMGGDRALLFGGNASGYNDETWIYDLSEDNWTQDTNTTQPSPRYTHGLAETSMDGSSFVVLFGGWASGSTYNGETWTFGGGDYALPVALSAFTATAEDRMVTLRWTTQSEYDNAGFHLYRSREEGRKYDRITQKLIAGSGNSSSSIDYSWIDHDVENGQTYWYRLESIDFYGQTQIHGPISATLTASQLDGDVLPTTCRLFPNYPNPFNPETWIRYQLPVPGPVTIRVYNVNGQMVASLVDADQAPGCYQTRWDGRDLHGSPAASGLYFCEMRCDQIVETGKMVLLR